MYINGWDSDLVWRAHHAKTAGHGGLHKSLAKLRQFYYWQAVCVLNFWRVNDLLRYSTRKDWTLPPQANAAERVNRSVLQILRPISEIGLPN